jgi:two-component system response regulator NreC
MRTFRFATILKGESMPVRVVIADDHPIVRKGLRDLLEEEPGIRVVGEAEDGTKALAEIQRLKPDIAIIDMMMPGHNGLEVIRQAKIFFPGMNIIVLSMNSNDAYVLEALKRGASGYILKETGPSELIKSVKVVLSGEIFLSAQLPEYLLYEYNQISDNHLSDPYESLTNREREIFQLAAEGLTSSEIAERLCISHRTVELHRSNFMEKLSLRHQTDLVRYAIKRGILILEE